MDSRDTVWERIEALEPRTERLQQPTRIVERRQRWWRSAWGVAAAVAFGLALTSPHAVQATTFDCRAGDVQCLIDAINTANANGEQNTIGLAAGTYTLTAPDNPGNGLPVITSPLTITGQGAETTIIERDAGAPDFRLFLVAAQGTLSLNTLTLDGGGDFVAGIGGAIFNSGTLTVTRSTIRGFNVSLSGGAIFNSGTLTVTRSTIRDNTAFSHGGIDNVGGTVTITNSTIEHNSGGHEGGGLGNMAGTIVITATTFAHNDADGGGAILNDGTLTVTNSAFTDNRAGGTGQGTIANFGTLVVINTTFARNVAFSFFPEKGAAIWNADTLFLINSTLADNQVRPESSPVPRGQGGSALASASGATTLLQNTLLARNVGSGGHGPDCVGVVTSLGTNLIGDPTGCTITLQPGDLTGDPGLGDFTDNGRPGNGHFPLLTTSQAIGAVRDAWCPPTDQLGRRRIGPCDIGAIAYRDQDNHQHDEEDDQDEGDPAADAQASP
jgi:hypothetical protein